MTFSRIVVNKETGKTKEETLPENFKHASEVEISRRKMMEAEHRRRRPSPFGALNLRDGANHPAPSGKKVEEVQEEEEADIRENPEGGKTQGTEDPTEADVEEQDGTEPSEEGQGEEDTPKKKKEK